MFAGSSLPVCHVVSTFLLMQGHLACTCSASLQVALSELTSFPTHRSAQFLYRYKTTQMEKTNTTLTTQWMGLQPASFPLFQPFARTKGRPERADRSLPSPPAVQVPASAPPLHFPQATTRWTTHDMTKRALRGFAHASNTSRTVLVTA